MINIKRHVPDTITSLNLVSGAISIFFSFGENFDAAFIFIIFAAVFDFLDGFSARILKAHTNIGKELDSLADLTSFGLAPSFMIMNKMVSSGQAGKYGLFLLFPLAIAVFSALRLAKFNIDERQTENFIGLATPSCALLIGSFISSASLYTDIEIFISTTTWFLPAVSIVLSFLLVSEIPMFSFKFKSLDWKHNAERFIFIIISAMLAVITVIEGLNWRLWIFSVFSTYLIFNLGLFIFRKK
ncbi:MAG: CDP-alcohol phosphatidyltransferase family protein [Bacteroidales bacterium]|jgi:CDP-diacylglycerol--serine O-phosphatidyltransferase|nr:CDP-alcohol phosphatidyltransferase family protein [Bacteroidales bacterium]